MDRVLVRSQKPVKGYMVFLELLICCRHEDSEKTVAKVDFIFLHRWLVLMD